MTGVRIEDRAAVAVVAAGASVAAVVIADAFAAAGATSN